MTTPKYFHFTIGPVQGFVAQARKTRDFWAGSFILSWLCGVAILEIKKQNGKITFPKIDENDPFLSWIEGKQTGEITLTQGSIPNRFTAEVNDNFDPKKIVDSVRDAWKALADDIYKEDIKDHEQKNTSKIWDRQINGFWEISWVITPDENDTSALDRRKNWRTWIPPVEPGVKCSLMDGWQELSGAGSHYEKTEDGEKEIDVFWNEIRKKDESLGKNEHLCAIAWVKRRFFLYFSELNAQMPSKWMLKGWKLPSAVPSVVYMAAVHWLEQVIKKAQSDEKIEEILWEFHDKAYKLTNSYGEWDTQIKCIKEIKTNKKWKSLAGDVFFKDSLKNKNNYSNQDQAKEVIKALDDLQKACGFAPPSPYYAVLLMDGDSLGKLLKERDKREAISESLKKFTEKVPEIVYDNNGFLVYAGGDDVLALLPLEDALPCAVELRQEYEKSFNGTTISSTISGAIEYAHMHVPLTKILRDAHGLLDNVAKDGCGRDAIAVRVWNTGGMALQWAQPWEIALDNSKTETEISRIANDFANADEKSAQFSSSFLYKIRNYFDLLNPHQKDESCVLSEEDVRRLMVSEYVSAMSNDTIPKKERIEKAKETVRRLLEQCRPVKRDAKEQNQKKWKRSKRIEADGAMLVRFLARKGVVSW